MDSYQHDSSPIALVLGGLFVVLFVALWAAVLIASVVVIAKG